MKSTFIYSTRVFHMPNVQKAILVKDTNYNKKIVPIYCKRIIFSVYDIWRNFNFWWI